MFKTSLNTLYLDKIFFETFAPIFFTCVDDNKNLYLCVHCLSSGSMDKQLVARTDAETIIKVLKNKIFLRDAFMVYSYEDKYSFNLVYNKKEIIINDKEDWDYENSLMLPTAKYYLDAEDGEYTEEIEYYESKIEK